MMGFAQSRLELDSEGQSLLSGLLASLNRATRTVLARSLRDGIDRREIKEPWALAAGCFPEAMTSSQRSLALRKAGDLRKTAQAKELWAGRERLELAKACGKKIARKREEIVALQKELSSLRKSPLARPKARRKLSERIARERLGLGRTIERKARLEAAGAKSLERSKSGRDKVCFGSRKLLGQRERIGAVDSPFGTPNAWRAVWSEARDGAFLLEGKALAASRNEHAKFDPSTGVLRIRLTEAQAEQRMAAMALDRGIPLADFREKPKYSPSRMECRFLEATLSFRGKRQAARLARLASILQAEGDAAVPVSWRIGRETVGGKVVFQARAQWAEREPEAKDWGLGALGADVNAWGIAWAAAKSDGNLARPKSAEGLSGFGSIQVSWGETSDQATHAARRAALTLVALAKERALPIVLENLDFSAKKRSLRYEDGVRASGGKRVAGSPPQRFRLSGFAYQKLIESIRARAAKEGVPVRFACPSWTSVTGFAKYGRRNGLNPDQAAALAIARKGLGLKGTKEKAVRRGGEKILVRNRPERIQRSWLSALPPRSRGKSAEPERRLSAFLGARRRDWGARLKRLEASALARATAGFPEGSSPSPDPNGSEGREAAARGLAAPGRRSLSLLRKIQQIK